MTACRCSACESNPALAKRVAEQRAADPTGDGAPDTGQLREEIARTLKAAVIGFTDENGGPNWSCRKAADELLAGPLAPLLAERGRVRALADELEADADRMWAGSWDSDADQGVGNGYLMASKRLRRAIRGPA